MSRRRIDNAPVRRRKSATATSDDYDDADIDDDALANAASVDRLSFERIDNFAETADAMTGASVVNSKPTNTKGKTKNTSAAAEDGGDNVPVQLPNGRWLCNHKCKDKEACKHYCCKHGLDKPPKKAAPKRVPTSNHQEPLSNKGSSQRDNKTQTKLQLTAPKRRNSAVIEELDLTQQEKKRKTEYAINGPRDFRDLHKLHKSVQKTEVPSSLHSVKHKKPAYGYGEGGEYQLSFLSQSTATRKKSSSEYGDLDIDEIASDPNDHVDPSSYDDSASLYFPTKAPVATHGSETFGDDDSMFGDALVGLADSEDLQMSIGMDETSADMSLPDIATDFKVPKHGSGTQAKVEHRRKPTQYRTPFLEATSSPERPRHATPAPAQATLYSKNLHKPLRSVSKNKQVTSASHHEPDDRDVYGDLLDLLDSTPTNNNESSNIKQAEPIVTSHQSPDTHSNAEQKEQKEVPDKFKDLQPWLFQEFGDLVELVSD
jgi:ATP-dependent DNA helicase HFM1/MER3